MGTEVGVVVAFFSRKIAFLFLYTGQTISFSRKIADSRGSGGGNFQKAY